MKRFCINGGQGGQPLASSFAAILPIGKMVSKCGCVGTHPMLDILLANPDGFAGLNRHRVVSFEPITPYPAIVFMLLYCGETDEKIRNCHSTSVWVTPVVVAV